MSKALGTDDSINTCDCCGKSGLKFTVTIELDSGEIAHYGSTCATRNTGKKQSQISSEIKAEHESKCAAAAAELKASAEYVALLAKMQQRPRTMLGRAAADFIRAESNAEFAKRQEIAAKHGVRPYEMRA